MQQLFYSEMLSAIKRGDKLLAVLIDPDKFDVATTSCFLNKIPKETTHLFVGGSTDKENYITKVVAALNENSDLPVFIFPGSYHQVTEAADALLFLSLHSGRNPEYLIEQQVQAASVLKNTSLEIIPTSYLLIDGGNDSAVARVSGTIPMSQDDILQIVNTALAGQMMGAKLVYLEAGSGAAKPVSLAIIEQVKSTLAIPLIVGGGIRTVAQREQAYKAGADLVVMGTVFEER